MKAQVGLGKYNIPQEDFLIIPNAGISLAIHTKKVHYICSHIVP